MTQEPERSLRRVRDWPLLVTRHPDPFDLRLCVNAPWVDEEVAIAPRPLKAVEVALPDQVYEPVSRRCRLDSRALSELGSSGLTAKVLQELKRLPFGRRQITERPCVLEVVRARTQEEANIVCDRQDYDALPPSGRLVEPFTRKPYRADLLHAAGDALRELAGASE